MSFAIEVAGEALPLQLPDLCRALQAGTSNDATQRQSASKQLDAWHAQPHYFSSLQSVFLDRTCPYAVRFLAIIQLKNGIDKFWRTSAQVRQPQHALTPTEKAAIRARLLQGTIDEGDRILALHNALATAKIVRIDYPHDWPEAVPDLVALLRRSHGESGAGSAAQVHGALLLLLRIIKELGTARLRRSQTALQRIAEELFYVVGDVYAASVTRWRSALEGGSFDRETVDTALANSLVALKTLRHLAIGGFEHPHRAKLVAEFWTLSQTQMDQFFGYVGGNASVPAAYQELIGKHLLTFTKLHMDMCDIHPASFTALPNAVILVRAYWGLVANFANVYTSSGGLRQSSAGAVGGGGGGTASIATKLEGPLLERLALKGLLLIRSCIQMITQPLQTFKYRNAETQQDQAEGVQRIKTELFTDDFMLQVVDVIISKLFAFRTSDLEAWDEDPEEWEAQESGSGAAWEWQVRPCAERVFLSLLIHNKQLLAPPLLAYFERAMGDSADLLTKEAVYTAMCNAAVAIEKAFDFGAFLHGTLAQDVQVQGPMAKILRRRVAILLGTWHYYELPETSLALEYSLYAHLLRKDDAANDVVVRLTAARQLRDTVDDVQFRAALFEPFAADVFAALLDLLLEVEIEETKLAVLETVRVFIQRLETLANRFSDGIMAALPTVWMAAGNEAYMIKQAVLTILSTLLMAVGGDTDRLRPLLLPLIADAMNPASPVHQFLLEEAVELWQALLSQSAAPLAPELVELLPLAVRVLDYDSHIVATSLAVVDAYIVLAPEAALSDAFRQSTLAGLAGAMETKRWEQSKSAAGCLRRMVVAAARLGGRDGVSVVVRDLLAVGYLPRMLELLHSAWVAHESTGPKAPKSPINTSMQVEYFVVLARLVLADPELFVDMLSGVAAQQPAAVGAEDLKGLWGWLAPAWFASFDCMGNPEHIKVSCLALTRLWELGPPMQPLVLDRLQDYFSTWTSAVRDAQGDATKRDTYVWDGPPPPTEYDTPLMRADAAFAAQDVLHTETTYAFIVLRLQDMMARVGGEQVFEENWAVNVDREVLTGFRQLTQPMEDLDG